MLLAILSARRPPAGEGTQGRESTPRARQRAARRAASPRRRRRASSPSWRTRLDQRKTGCVRRHRADVIESRVDDIARARARRHLSAASTMKGSSVVPDGTASSPSRPSRRRSVRRRRVRARRLRPARAFDQRYPSSPFGSVARGQACSAVPCEAATLPRGAGSRRACHRPALAASAGAATSPASSPLAPASRPLDRFAAELVFGQENADQGRRATTGADMAAYCFAAMSFRGPGAVDAEVRREPRSRGSSRRGTATGY